MEKLNKKMEIISGEKTQWELVGVIDSCIREKASPEEPSEPGKRGLTGTRVLTSWKRKWWQEKQSGDRAVGQPPVNYTTSGGPLPTYKMKYRRLHGLHHRHVCFIRSCVAFCDCGTVCLSSMGSCKGCHQKAGVRPRWPLATCPTLSRGQLACGT